MFESENTIITITSLTWPSFESDIRLSILGATGKRLAAMRRSAGVLKKHFETDYSAPEADSKGFDKLGLCSVANLADIEEADDGSLTTDLLVKASDGNCYSVREVKGMDEIYTEAELYSIALDHRSENVDS